MASRGGRSIWGAVWKNFVNSLRPRQLTGNLIGVDHNGNKYFEIPADPERGKRHPSRWFMPVGGEKSGNFDTELPAEWEAWLRGRRIRPPTPQEIEESMALMRQKKKNAAAIDRMFSTPKGLESHSLREKRGSESFPKYNEYEVHPGTKPGKPGV